MRKRDWVFAGIAGAGFLAWLVWALTTQLRWVRENKPIERVRPEEPRERERHGSEVVGPVSDETRAVLAKHLEEQRKAKEKGEKR